MALTVCYSRLIGPGQPGCSGVTHSRPGNQVDCHSLARAAM